MFFDSRIKLESLKFVAFTSIFELLSKSKVKIALKWLYVLNFVFVVLIDENTSLEAKGALANRLQRRTAFKIQNGRQGAPKWRMGSGKVSTPRFLGVLSNFC